MKLTLYITGVVVVGAVCFAAGAYYASLTGIDLASRDAQTLSGIVRSNSFDAITVDVAGGSRATFSLTPQTPVLLQTPAVPQTPEALVPGTPVIVRVEKDGTVQTIFMSTPAPAPTQ